MLRDERCGILRGKTMISLQSKGDFKKTEKFLKKAMGRDYRKILDKYGKQGVDALVRLTPFDTGTTASMWYYEIIQNDGYISIEWNNSNINKGVNIAIILQYGHGTRNGKWVEGTDYINPALKLIFKELADAAWKEVTSI